MCDQNSIRVTAGDKTRQNTDKGHTPSPKKEIKIHDPTGNRIRATGLEGRFSTDHGDGLYKNFNSLKFVCFDYIGVHHQNFLQSKRRN